MSSEAEQHVLAYMLLNDDAFLRGRNQLKPDDFTDGQYRQIFEALLQCTEGTLREARVLHVRTLLMRRLESRPATALIGKMLCELSHAIPSAYGMNYFVDRILESSHRRAALEMATSLVSAASSETSDYMAVIREKYDAITSKPVTGSRTALIGSRINATLEEMELAKGRPMHAASGIEALDATIRGFTKGENICVAGLTGTGKSALAMSMAIHNAQRGRSVAYFSLEMSEEQLQQRILAHLTGINLQSIASGTYSKDDRRTMVAATAELHNWKLGIYDSANQGIRDIASRCITHRNDHGLDFVVVDYLQLVKPDNPKASRYEQVTNISRAIKLLARELECPVVALSQFNREAVKEKEPRIFHLKDSGAIGEDADMVLILSERQSEPGEELERFEQPIRLRLDKCRRAALAVFMVVFDKAHQRFGRPRIDALDNPFNDALDAF